MWRLFIHLSTINSASHCLLIVKSRSTLDPPQTSDFRSADSLFFNRLFNLCKDIYVNAHTQRSAVPIPFHLKYLRTIGRFLFIMVNYIMNAQTYQLSYRPCSNKFPLSKLQFCSLEENYRIYG